MEQTMLEEELEGAEGLLLQGEAELARDRLARLADDAEEYVDRNCQTTEEQQFFSFPSAFEYLAYVRVEQDPRTLYDVGEPLGRLYADLARADVALDDREGAMASLRQAVRWNPMDCASRLNLAELYRAEGDVNEFLALSYSVFERASEPGHLVRAYLNFSRWLSAQGKARASAAALRAARSLDADDAALAEEVERARADGRDPDALGDQEATDALSEEGLPFGASAEIAICLLECGLDAARAGEAREATTFVVRARDLVGEPAAMTLLEALREADADAGADAGVDAGRGAHGDA
ncbi:MAG: hypothetical protein SOH58_05920 [Olsenella sp.]